MTGQRGAAPPAQQPEHVIKSIDKASQAKAVDATGCKLNSQGHAVQLLAQMRHQRIVIGQHCKAIIVSGGTLDKELQRRVLDGLLKIVGD